MSAHDIAELIIAFLAVGSTIVSLTAFAGKKVTRKEFEAAIDTEEKGRQLAIKESESRMEVKLHDHNATLSEDVKRVERAVDKLEARFETTMKEIVPALTDASSRLKTVAEEVTILRKFREDDRTEAIIARRAAAGHNP